MSADQAGSAALLLVELSRAPRAAIAVIDLVCGSHAGFSRLELVPLAASQMLTLHFPECEPTAMERLARRLLMVPQVVGVTGCFAFAKDD